MPPSALTRAARRTWTIDSASQFEAMTRCYEHQGWGVYTTDFPEIDMQTYRERGWG